MRLKSIWISNYKNLRDFSLNFEGDEFLDVFVGKNGSGKSNFFEALIEIFDHLYTHKKGHLGPGFSYHISWHINEETTHLKWVDESFDISIGSRKLKTLRTVELPANIVIYYSGQNDTVADLIRRYRESYRRTVRLSNVATIPRFIGIGPDYKAMLLALMLMLPENIRAREFLCQKLGIEGIGGTTLLTLKRPSVARKSGQYDPFDDNQLFWGVKGIARDFLDQLLDCIPRDFTRGSLYDRETDTYKLDIDVAEFRNNFSDTPADDVFCLFNSLRALDMIDDVSIAVRLSGEVEVSSRAFSDGQFQSVYLFAISELFKNRECLTLLDEPDAFLHPEWQYDFLNQVHFVSEEAARSNHILMSSHSASTIASQVESRLHVFEVTDREVTPTEHDKSEIIESLSAGLIRFSEQEASLSIHQFIRNSDRPVLFTEGITDELILETAWNKIYPDRECPFDIQRTFGCKFLGALLRSEEIYAERPNRCFFAIFDFDEAYNNWNSRRPEFVQEDITLGLTHKKPNQNGYFIMIPVPAQLSVRNQVVNPNTGDHFQSASLLPIELLFHDVPGLEAHFCDDNSRPGNVRKFSSSKVNFASNVVPRIDAQHFECFRPIFDFIDATI